MKDYTGFFTSYFLNLHSGLEQSVVNDAIPLLLLLRKVAMLLKLVCPQYLLKGILGTPLIMYTA